MASFFSSRAFKPIKAPFMARSPWGGPIKTSAPIKSPWPFAPSSPFKIAQTMNDARSSYVAAQLSAFGAYDGIWDSIKSVAQAVIPSHTVVGKAIAGDYSGAASGAIKFAVSATSKPAATPVAITPSAQSGGGGFGGMPSWAWPVIGIGGALALVMFLKPRGRRR